MRFKLQEFDGAIADFDREIQLDPSKGANHWQRGIAYYYAERYIDCRDQFELSYKTVNPNDYENGIFYFLCTAKDQGAEKAQKSMLKIQGDERLPMQQIYDLYRGRGTVEDVLAAAESGGPAAAQLKDRLFYGHLYVGLYLDAIGEAVAARPHIELAVENFPVAHFMWDVGRVQLTRMPEVAEPAPAVFLETALPEPKTFRDPRPSKQPKPSGESAPEPRAHPEVTFHQAPKPLPPGAVAGDWKSFLGPTHNAVSPETKLLASFPESGPRLVWEMKKGTSYTSPAISGDRLVFLHRVGNKERVECLRAETGELIWQDEYPTDFSDRYGYNNGPRASPVIDEDRVYIYSAQARLQCRRLADGGVLWERDVAKEFRVKQDFFGVAGSPLVDGELLIVNIGAPGGPTVGAFNKLTGELVWGAGDKWGAGYASAVPATVNGVRRLYVFAGGESKPPTGGLLMLDPLTGRIGLEFPWRSESYESVNASSPVAIGDQVFVSASYQTGAVLLRAPEPGRHQVVWANPGFDLHFTTAIHHEGYLYAFTGRNEPDAALVAVELATGKEKWRAVPEWKETIVANGQAREITESTFRGSLLRVDGRFLAIGEHGHLLWMDLTPDGYQILSRARLFNARETWALPVISRGLLYVTQNTRSPLEDKPPRLLCYDLRAEH